MPLLKKLNAVLPIKTRGENPKMRLPFTFNVILVHVFEFISIILVHDKIPVQQFSVKQFLFINATLCYINIHRVDTMYSIKVFDL